MLKKQMEQIAREVAEAGNIRAGQLIVIGASTSEVVGRKIGTAGGTEAASAIYSGLKIIQQELGCHFVFQCCEHLNRALVMEREVAVRYGLDEVSAVPIRKAGGAMAAYAYRQMREPCLVETVQAHAGIDIGETMIGMHLRRVAVPFRPSIRQLGEARVTAAYTRLKLIGGERAVYQAPQQGDESC